MKIPSSTSTRNHDREELFQVQITIHQAVSITAGSQIILAFMQRLGYFQDGRQTAVKGTIREGKVEKRTDRWQSKLCKFDHFIEELS
jgi:hypothetical protein